MKEWQFGENKEWKKMNDKGREGQYMLGCVYLILRNNIVKTIHAIAMYLIEIRQKLIGL